MTDLDIEALLAKNPQVDRERLKEVEDKIAETRKIVGRKQEAPVKAPYGGRRLRQDDSRKEPDIIQHRRTG